MKKVITLISAVGTSIIFIGRNSIELGLCSEADNACRSSLYSIGEISYFFPLILLFSLIIYWLPVQVFKSWLKFLLVWGPITIIVTTLVHLQWHHRGGGIMNMDNIFDVPIILTMYGVFVLGSLIQIYRGWNRKLK
jgi:hypothetical protein